MEASRKTLVSLQLSARRKPLASQRQQRDKRLALRTQQTKTKSTSVLLYKLSKKGNNVLFKRYCKVPFYFFALRLIDRFFVYWSSAIENWQRIERPL